MDVRPSNTSEKRLLYAEIAARVGRLIEQGTYRPGERIPSVRRLSRQMRVSVGTVTEAYARLENLGVIEARPQSGYYVRSRPAEPAPSPAAAELVASPVSLDEVPLRIMRTLREGSLLPLGTGGANPELLPADKLHRMLATESRRFRIQSIAYAGPRGAERLRMQISRRALDAGCSLPPEEIVVTSGCVEAVTLALQAVCRPGDTVAMASPVYYTFLHAVQWLGLKLLEIPATPQEGINLDVLAYALRHAPVHACVVIANFNNPLGSLISEGGKRRLVRLLAEHDVPLIEDDVYGDLAFDADRPISTKAFDEKGLVLYCSSFSKTLAPGYRIGWIAPGRYAGRVQQLKALFNLCTATPTQLAIAEFLANGGYDHHLRTIRRTYSRNVSQLREAVCRQFPLGTRVTHPGGGFMLWVELPERIDTLALYEQAVRAGIGFAPGCLFTTARRFTNCLRLNAAYWSERVEPALETLGELAKGLAKA